MYIWVDTMGTCILGILNLPFIPYSWRVKYSCIRDRYNFMSVMNFTSSIFFSFNITFATDTEFYVRIKNSGQGGKNNS